MAFVYFFLSEFFINQATESCLGVLNNQYNDSVTWHDIGKFDGEIKFEHTNILLNI